MSSEQSTVQYRDVPGFPGYRVGDDGSVWSATERRSLGIGLGTCCVIGNNWHRMKPSADARGRLRVTLRDREKNKSHKKFVHLLVLQAFVGERPAGMEGCHTDDNKANNSLGNLRWDTKESNTADCLRNGLQVCGEENNTTKITAAIVLRIRSEHASGHSYPVLSKRYGLVKSQIGNIVKRLHWKHVA